MMVEGTSARAVGASGQRLAAHLAFWLADEFRMRGAATAVVALSGGVDSAVAAALCARALGRERVFTLGLPIHSAPEDLEDAMLVARTLSVPIRVVDLGPVLDALLTALGPTVASNRLAAANLRPRLRMASLYAEASLRSGLVVGTGNRDELHVGYFTKHGDGGVDLLPLARATKAEVRAIGRTLGLPEKIVERVPTAGLWQGQTDEAELGFTYADLDRLLLTGEGSPELRARVDSLHRMAQHKLVLPAMPPPLAPVPERDRVEGA